MRPCCPRTVLRQEDVHVSWQGGGDGLPNPPWPPSGKAWELCQLRRTLWNLSILHTLPIGTWVSTPANSPLHSSCGPDGKCYAFDHRAQGYGRGEGVAALIVKRLDDAIRNGDPIRAVIRETGINQDGRSPTITSPDRDAQYDLIRACYAKAGLDPLATSVVEAHGTGTSAGDPVEAEAIGRALRDPKRSRQTQETPLYMASVKTNLGHTEAVSGLASVIKMVKSLEHGKIAPSINFEKPNPAIDFDGLSLKVSCAVYFVEWTRKFTWRREGHLE